MNDTPKFGMFDRERETSIENRHLPHWFQPGVAVFVTIRTADSLPKHVILQWHQELLERLRKAGVGVRDDREPPRIDLIPSELQNDYKKLRDRLWHWHLDSCHGRCVLRKRELAQLVLDSLLHFNGERYELASAIVMPNHVHLIAQFYAPITCRTQCESWMHYSAWQINRSLGQSGAFWQSEPFDHLIRSEAQFFYLQNYIAENGRMAGLPPSDYLYWHMYCGTTLRGSKCGTTLRGRNWIFRRKNEEEMPKSDGGASQHNKNTLRVNRWRNRLIAGGR